MKILINTFGRDLSDREEWRIAEIISNFHERYPDDEIGIICQEGLNHFSSLKDKPNIRILAVRHTALLNRMKQRKQVKRFIETEPADAVLGVSIATNSTRRQYLLPEPFYTQSEKLSEKDKIRFKKEIDGAISVITLSEMEKAYLSSLFPDDKIKFESIYLINIPQNEAITFNEKQPIKQRWAAGNEFFLCHPGWDKNATINTLKGFSGFKKWQQSHMKLLLSARNKQDEAGLKELIKDYRFKENIGIIRVDEYDYLKVISAAYAFIVPDKFESNFDLPLKSIAAEIPVIIPKDSILSEKLGNAAFYFEYGNKDDITRILLESFRDEQKKSGIISSHAGILDQLANEEFAVRLREILEGGEHQNIS